MSKKLLQSKWVVLNVINNTVEAYKRDAPWHHVKFSGAVAKSILKCNKIDTETLRKIDNWLNGEYPLTVIADRYEGTYSGGKFTAWPCLAHEIPQEAYSSDGICGKFWGKYDKPVGRGKDTVDSISNLASKMRKHRLRIIYPPVNVAKDVSAV